MQSNFQKQNLHFLVHLGFPVALCSNSMLPAWPACCPVSGSPAPPPHTHWPSVPPKTHPACFFVLFPRGDLHCLPGPC